MRTARICLGAVLFVAGCVGMAATRERDYVFGSAAYWRHHASCLTAFGGLALFAQPLLRNRQRQQAQQPGTPD